MPVWDRPSFVVACSAGHWSQGCRDTVSAKLEWKLVLGTACWSALSSSGGSGRIGIAVLVVHILLRGRLGSLLLAGRLGLGWGQLLLLRLPLPSAVRHTVHFPSCRLAGGPYVPSIGRL